MRALAAGRQTTTVAEPAVRTDFHQAFDIEGNLFAQIAFDPVLLFDDFPDLVHIIIIEFPDFCIGAYAGGGQDLVRYGTSDAIDIRKSDFNPFIGWKIYASYTCHLYLR
jgi:hypothetical protein